MNEKVQKVAKEKLGRETSYDEIEMMKFVMLRTVFQIEKAVEVRESLTIEERRLHQQWKKEGRVTEDHRVTPEFWEAISAILWERYGQKFNNN